MSKRENTSQRERQREKQTPHWAGSPIWGSNPRALGSWPELKADTRVPRSCPLDKTHTTKCHNLKGGCSRWGFLKFCFCSTGCSWIPGYLKICHLKDFLVARGNQRCHTMDIFTSQLDVVKSSTSQISLPVQQQHLLPPPTGWGQLRSVLGRYLKVWKHCGYTAK